VAETRVRELEDDHYIRQKLFGGDKTALERYRELVVGERGSLLALVRQELVTTLLGPIPGALGLFLRKLVYPRLFPRIGRGVVFGRNVTLRHCARIRLGDRVVIDDDCLIDARGSGEQGVEIGDEVVLNRRVSIQSKVGAIRIGAACDLGADTAVVAQGPIEIGERVSIGGGAMVGGGLIQLDGGDSPDPGGTPPTRDDFASRGQRRFSKGPIRIGARCVFGSHVTVLDGVRVGEGAMIGAAAVLRDDVPEGHVAMPHQRLLVVPCSQFGRSASVSAGASATPAAAAPAAAKPAPEQIQALLHRVFDELDAQLPPDRRLPRVPDAPLVEPDGPLDSLGLVNLIVTTEQFVEEELGRAIDLIDAHGRRVAEGDAGAGTPFASAEALAARVAELLSG